MSEHLSDLKLDALRIDNARESVTDADRSHLAECPVCLARKGTLDEAAQAFAARFDAVGLAADALSRAETKESKPRSWFRPLWAAAAAVAAVILAIVLLPPARDLRKKGGAELAQLFVIEAGARIPWEGTAAADAHLALFVSPEGTREVRILWSSAPEAWAALYPQADAPSWKLAAPSWLAREIVLDGAPEDEELGVVACEHEVAHEDAARMLEAGAREDCVVERLRMEKR